MLENRPVPESTPLVGREKLITSAIDLIDGGASVDVVGVHASGKTAVLAAIGARTDERGGRGIRLRGIPGLRSHPLAALHAAGIGSSAAPRDQRPATAVQHAVDALERVAAAPGAVIIIDDAADVDDTSLGVVDAVCGRNGVPVVASYASDGVAPTCIRAGYRLELAPLRFDDLEALAVQRLEAPVEGTTMSRLYAESGGTAGVALSLLDEGCRDGSLALARGAWRAEGALWSPLLYGRVLEQLSGLTDAEREALEIISLLGGADLTTVVELCRQEVVERLEAAGAVRLLPNEETPIVAVAAPHVAEYFRRTAPGVRTLRLLERARTAVGRTDLLEHPADEADALGPSADYPLLVRLIRDRAGRAAVSAAAEQEEHVDEPLALSEVARGRPLEEVEAELRTRAEGLGVPALVVEAAAIRLRCAAARVPSDAPARLAGACDLPPGDRLRVLETAMGAALSLGRVSEARRLGETISAEAGPDAGAAPIAAASYGVALLADGEYAEATAWALEGLDSARNRLDGAGIRSHGFAAALALTLAGRYAEAEQIIADVLALGTPSAMDIGVHLRLLAVADVVAARRDNADLREKLASELSLLIASGHPGSPILAEWHRAQSLAYEGRPREAAVVLRRLGDRLWERNERLLGVLALLVSIELHGDPGLLRSASERLADVDSELLRVRLDFLTARQHQDARAMLDLPARLHATGQPGLAVTAFRLAAEWCRAAGDDEAAALADSERAGFVERLGSHPYDTVRFSTVALNLTEREREIGRLVANGLTNPQIAAQLVLSVRTVESHLNRIMRKTALGSRAELASLVAGMTR